MLRRLVPVVVLVSLWNCGGGDGPVTPPPVPTLTVTCPPAVQGQSTDGQPVAVSYGAPQASGGQGAITLSCTPPSGSLFPGGTTNVTCTAVDARTVTATCNVKVFVQVPPRLIGNGHIVAFGDSITAGTPGGGTFSPYSVITSEFAYPLKLELLLKERYRLQNPRVEAEGIPAEYAQDGVDRLPVVLARYNPDIVIIMEGTNDLLFLNQGMEDAAVAIRKMVQQAKALNVKVLLSTVIPQRAGGLRVPPRDPYAAFVPLLNAKIKEIATAENVPLVDMYAVFQKDMTLIGIDDVHPTPRGFQVMAETFFEAIKANFEVPHPTAGISQ